MAPEQKPEVERAIDDIRREVIESRNLVIKTDNLLKNLHAELKHHHEQEDEIVFPALERLGIDAALIEEMDAEHAAMSDALDSTAKLMQEDFQKRQWISSGAAYAIVAALCVGGAVLVSSARTATAGAERDRLQKQADALTEQVAAQKAELNAQQQAQRTAGDIYRMMTTLPGDERLKGVDALAKLDRSRLSALELQALNDRAELLRKEVGQTAFERGKSAFRRQDYPAAVAELTRFMAMNPNPEDSLDASFFLGASLTQTRKHEEAIPYLDRFVREDKRSKTRDYAMLLLAQSYDFSNQHEKAAEVAREALGTYPSSQFTGQLKGRLSAAKRAMNGGAESTPAQTNGAPAAPAQQAR